MGSRIFNTATAFGLSAAIASAATADITVSSKIDTEGGLLGNVIALALEDAGLPVKRRLQLGGTQVVREALLANQIDIYPEYTGNAAFFFNEADSVVWKGADAADYQKFTCTGKAHRWHCLELPVGQLNLSAGC